MGKGRQASRIRVESQMEKALHKRWSERQELLFDTDKLLIAYYMALGCLDG